MNWKDTVGKLLDPQLEPKGQPAGQPMADEQLRKAVKKAFAEVRQQLEQQQREIDELRKQVGNLKNTKRELDSLEKDIRLLIERQTPPPAPVAKPVSTPAPAPTPPPPPPAPSYPCVLYAKTVDCFRPVGFVAENLRTSDERCLFKVVLSDHDNGTFELVDNFEMRQVMLAAFTPLVTETSEYSNLPLDPLDINTINKGTLRREGAVLVIMKKQTVKIV